MKQFLIGIICIFWSAWLIRSEVSANVDTTSLVTYTYDCTVASGGILHATYDLWGHHIYVRDYEIDLPGVMEIADETHTTLAKSRNVSINWCRIPPTACTITDFGAWSHVVSGDQIVTSLVFQTDLPLTQLWTRISVDGTTNTGETILITYNGTTYDVTGKLIHLDQESDALKLTTDGTMQSLASFTNTDFDGQYAYIYTTSADKKETRLIKRKFQRVNSGNVISSPNEFDEFAPVRGYNVPSSATFDPEWDANLSADRNAQGPNYVTWLDFWDYTQHNYTTTKVKIHPVMLSCLETEDSLGAKGEYITPYEGTLEGIVQSTFAGEDLVINSATGEAMLADTSLLVEWLTYRIVGEVGWVKDRINQVTIALRDDGSAISKWISTMTIPEKGTVGDIWDVWFELKEKTDECQRGVEPTCRVPGIIQAGDYVLEIIFSYDWNIVWESLTVNPFIIKPNNNYTKQNAPIVTSSGGGFANATDSFNICQRYADSYGNTYYHTGIIQTSLIGTGWHLNQINSTGEAVFISGPRFEGSTFCFQIRAYAPWSKWLSFEGLLPLRDVHDRTVGYIAQSVSQNTAFIKPLIALLQVIDAVNPDEFTLRPKVGTMQKYILQLQNIWNLQNFTDWAVNISEDTIHLTQEWHVFQDFSGIANSFSNNINSYLGFSARINATWSVLNDPRIETRGLQVSYTLSGKTIVYPLNWLTTPVSSQGIVLWSNDLVSFGLRVIGNMQLTGKALSTWQKDNISYVSNAQQANLIRKNAGIVTRNMKSWDVANGLRYFTWSNILVGGEQEYETIVVENGNVIITDDINRSWKKLGIIVLSWSVYVMPSVRYIHAIVFADGWFISAKSSDDLVSFLTDSPERTDTLTNQLILEGTLLTKNTIGWGILGTSLKYRLPDGSDTTDFNEAMRYDLNYIRRSNEGWELQKDKNLNNNDNFIIIYDPSVLSDPPRGFQ